MFHFWKKGTIEEKLFQSYNVSRKIKEKNKFCFAPFKSMLFNQNGDVMICHYNRGYIAGRYPEQSILEIWNNQKMDKFRKAIENKDLSLGCFQCEERVLNNQPFSVPARKYDYLSRNSSKNNFPTMLDFQISNICNCECLMCSGEYSSLIRTNREKKPPYPTLYSDSFLLEIESLIPHLKVASFTGGEPFIIPLYHRIWEKIIDINPAIQINVSTNATFIPDFIKPLIEKGQFNFTVSLDSMIPKIYESIRQHATFEKTIENTEYLHKYSLRKKTYFAIKSCIITKNYQEFPELFEYWNTQRVILNPKLVVYPPAYSLRFMSPDEIQSAIISLRKYSPLPNSTIERENTKRYSEVLQQLELWKNESLTSDVFNLYHNSSIEVIEEKLFDKILAKKNEDFSEKVYRIFSQIRSSISDEFSYKILLINLHCIPLPMLLNELHRNSEERITERLKQASIENF